MPGQKKLSLDDEQILDEIEFLSKPPIAKLRQTSAQSIPNNSATPVTFDVEDFDTHSGHSTASNTDQYVVPIAGYYAIAGKLAWPSNATGSRASQWSVNGTLAPGSQNAFSGVAASRQFPAATIILALAAGDILRMNAFQDSGGALSLEVTPAQFQPYASIQWIGHT